MDAASQTVVMQTMLGAYNMKSAAAKNMEVFEVIWRLPTMEYFFNALRVEKSASSISRRFHYLLGSMRANDDQLVWLPQYSVRNCEV